MTMIGAMAEPAGVERETATIAGCRVHIESIGRGPPLLAADAYGGVKPGELLEAVDHRMALISARWQAGIERGDAGTLALRDTGIMDWHHARVRAFDARREAIRFLHRTVRRMLRAWLQRAARSTNH